MNEPGEPKFTYLTLENEVELYGPTRQHLDVHWGHDMRDRVLVDIAAMNIKRREPGSAGFLLSLEEARQLSLALEAAAQEVGQWWTQHHPDECEDCNPALLSENIREETADLKGQADEYSALIPRLGPNLLFWKGQGLGNDFIIAHDYRLKASEEALPRLAMRWCDRRTGIGADGLLLIGPSDKADYKMRLINADGSEAEMCGNGIRCVARLAFETGIAAREQTVETLAGLMKPRVNVVEGQVVSVTVDMGAPHLRRREIPMAGPDTETVVQEPLAVNGRELDITVVSMGNPHVVVFGQSWDREQVRDLGSRIERLPVFPARTNVQFTEVLRRNELRVSSWERGAGATRACGTGACAAVVAAHMAGFADRRASVHLPGGTLAIEWTEAGPVLMTGPAEIVYTGEVALDG